MGKDNVPFHTVIFPATLLGTGRPWTLMRAISVTEYLNYEKVQFSKSRGVGVFGNDARDTNIPVEARCIASAVLEAMRLTTTETPNPKNGHVAQPKPIVRELTCY